MRTGAFGEWQKSSACSGELTVALDCQPDAAPAHKRNAQHQTAFSVALFDGSGAGGGSRQKRTGQRGLGAYAGVKCSCAKCLRDGQRGVSLDEGSILLRRAASRRLVEEGCLRTAQAKAGRQPGAHATPRKVARAGKGGTARTGTRCRRRTSKRILRARACVVRSLRPTTRGRSGVGVESGTHSSHSTLVPTILTKGRATWVCHSCGACRARRRRGHGLGRALLAGESLARGVARAYLEDEVVEGLADLCAGEGPGQGRAGTEGRGERRGAGAGTRSGGALVFWP